MSASAAGKDPIEPMAAPTSSTPKPTNPPANASPVPDQEFLGRCEHTVISLNYLFTDASLGSRTAEVHATNQSSKSCRLRGLPDLAFADTNGDEVRVRLVREDSGATVLLKPGATAVAGLSWRADAGANDLAVESVWMGAYRGASRIVAAAALDVRNGSELHVVGWKLP